MVKGKKRKATLDPATLDNDDRDGQFSDGVSDSSSPDSNDSNGDESKSDVDLTFTSYNMDRLDYHAIIQFLMVTFGRGVEALRGGECGIVDTRMLGKIIVDLLGEYVGTTAKVTEEDGPLAFVSLIPFNLTGIEFEWKDEYETCLNNIAQILLTTARKSNSLDKKNLKSVEETLLNLEHCAMILQERFMNLPVEVGVPLYKQLVDDLPAAGEESSSFQPKNVLFIVPIYRELKSELNQEVMGKKRPKATDMEEEDLKDASEYNYYYAEDELLANLTTKYWDFRIKTPHETSDSRRAFGDRGVDPARRVFLLTLEEFHEFSQQCQSFLDP